MTLQLERLSKKYGSKLAVDNFTYAFKSGIYGLLGENGAGKTTLMSMICNIQKPSQGKILLEGQDINWLGKDYRKQLGYLPQEIGYYPEFTAYEFLIYMSALKELHGEKAEQQVVYLLQTVGLWEEANNKIKTFSGGMKRRLGIAQAMLNNPSILILDEPTAGLDPQERMKFRNLISVIAKERIVLLSTHIISDIESMADNVLIMKKGKLICEGKKTAILNQLLNCVWECCMPLDKMGEVTASYLVSNLRIQEENVFIRIICKEKPFVDAVSAVPNLEDLYLYYFGQEGVNYYV